jgi:predicted ribosome quality control (RQC) complex YloA/Tae2 family protein
MKKLEVTSTAFFYIVNFLEKELLGGYINNIQLINYESNDIIKLKIHKTKTKELIVTPNVLFITDFVLPVNPENGGLLKFLKKKLYNQKIQEIKQDKNNRVVFLKLDTYYLIFEFFSSSNIILTDLEFNIITSKQKEEWKDRTIKRGEKYLFPKGKEINLKKPKELLLEIADLNLKDTISYLVKEYNVAPAYISEIKTKEKMVTEIERLYSLEYAKLKLVEGKTKEAVLVLIEATKEQQTTADFFKGIAENYIQNIQAPETKIEIKSKNKQTSILDSQIEKRKEYEKIAKDLEIEAQKIYEYFTVLEKINEQIRLAREKKIPNEEILKKLNAYFSKNYKELNIKSINTKEQSYILEIK